MTFNMKEWIAKVTAKQVLLKYITDVTAISIGSNTSQDITVNNGDKVIIIGVGAGNAKIVALVNADSSGTVTNLKVAGATNMTLTNGTNKITVNNGYGYTMSTLIVKFSVNV